ncbi:BTAD domain-containing putative transcriptional regulator [Umezawaea endophytica]|uniref:Tetratricopeptide repeat protein n=1 Tax=Umezawaea endophytica TaxID=1654476 RepID=A0A9X2VMV3_9PSEU|nr:BTAD domain-containing putative transcriptional regulator [Umezawaea endophytica]MCS7479427.1 tetratricopeptide repeat protein [Umezawaea endophytica]
MTAAETQVEFQVLGSLQVSASGGLLRLTGRRQRTLLALLLVNADHAVSLDTLIDAVWDDRPPTTAKRQVQNSVSALRRLLEAGERDPDPAVAPTIAAEGSGYRLRLGASTLDASLFQARVDEARRLSAAGETGAAAAEFRAGLRLWRGPALAGLPGRAFEAAAARLDEQRRAAVEECVELELRLGRHAELVGELVELVAANPLRERLVGQLMVALHRSGRQAEALEAYHRLRGVLADELGLEPGARLRELHTAVLRDEAGDTEAVPSRPAAGRVVPAQLPVDVIGFTGRVRHLKELDEVLPGGEGTVVTAIAGMAGIGKTALAVHWGQRVRHHFPQGQLYVNLRGFDADGSPVRPADVLLGFLEALDVPPPRVPVGLAARSALYRSLLVDRRVLVVLDNARDADQVRPLLPGSRGCHVVVTSRRVLSGLVAAEGARPVVLGLFDPAEAQQMLALRLGRERLAAEPDAVDEIITRCASLPLALAVVAARAAIHPDFPLASLAAELRTAQGSLDALGGDDPATDVRAVFSWSYHQLSEPARLLFRSLGLSPCPDVTERSAASLTGLPVDRTRALLAELVGACLVTAQAPGRYACHDLLRAYAAELARGSDTDGQRREALHRLVDHYLHSARAADRLIDAHRDPITIPPVQPGVVVDEHTDHEHAMRWLTDEFAAITAVVERAASTGFDDHAWRLAWAVAYFAERRGLWEPWAAAQHTALASARRIGDRLGQAHAHRSLGRVHVHLDKVADAVVHLRHALRLFRETGDTAGEARVHFDLCWIDFREGEHATSLAHAERAFELFRDIGHLSGQARALNNIAWGHNLRGDHEQALDAAERARRLNEEIADRFGDADTWDVLGHAHQGLGHHEESIPCYEKAAGLYRDLGHRWAEAETIAHLGDAHLAAGAVEAAHDDWHRALVIFDELGHPDADAVRSKLGSARSR